MDDQEREWSQHRLWILSELNRQGQDFRNLNDKIERFRQEDVAQMKTDIALLKFQAALYGAVAGIIATGIITLAIRLLRF